MEESQEKHLIVRHPPSAVYMKECPRCHNNMSEGFILDYGDHNAKNLQHWVAGEPVRSFWAGLKTSDRHQYEVSTWRCDQCGYLESYAQTPVE